MKILKMYLKANLLHKVFLALILAVILGSILSGKDIDLEPFFTPFGDIFIRLLKMILMPVVLCSLIVALASLSPKRLGKIGLKSLIYYLLTSLCAILIGLFIANIAGLGKGLVINANNYTPSLVDSPNILQILLEIIPTNGFDAIANGAILPSMFFASLFGIALAFGRSDESEEIRAFSELVFKFFKGLEHMIYLVFGWIMHYAPIGIFALVFLVFFKNGVAIFGPLISISIWVYVAYLLQILLIYCGLCLFYKLSPLRFLQKARMPFLTAFATRSSSASIPVSLEATKKMGVSEQIASFNIPIGATINMDGTTIYLGICTIFIANALGLSLDLNSYLIIIFTALLGSIGTAGVSGAGLIMLLMVLDAIGLKLEAGNAVAVAYAMIFGIDAILEMGRGGVNVLGDIAGSLVVAKSENELDLTKYNS